ncbi:MAG: B12-binding domain-containing radical SAM protein, partial [Candidatus Thorarchaeota archaeon]
MRFSKVLLVSPPSVSYLGGLRVPAGIGYIAQALYDESIEYAFIDMRIGNKFKHLKKKTQEFKPDLIGISMITQGYKHTYKIISDLKKIFPKINIVVGGHHVTILKEEVLKECMDIDFGVVGEGEKTIIELCKDQLPIEEIKGLILRKGDQVIYTGDREIVKNLDKYAFPKYKNFNMKEYSKQIPISSSRGCVGQCTFCPNKVIGRRYREKSVKYFVDEIEYWYRNGYHQFAIDDDNFTLNNKRMYRICDEIEKRNLKNLFIRCSNGIRADRVDKKLLARMKEIGIFEVAFGVDGGNNKVLSQLKKGETIEQIEQAIKDACDLGMDVKAFIIIGTPHETKADIEDSFKLAKKYPIAKLNLNNAIPYPGTEMYDYIKENDLFLIPPEEYLNFVAEDIAVPVFETPELPKEEREKILKRAHKIENEVMKAAAYRMYKHYPIFGILVKYFFNETVFEKLFFNNLLFRNLF